MLTPFSFSFFNSEEFDVTTPRKLKQIPTTTPKPTPHYDPQIRFLDRVSQPYFGVHDRKLWDKNGFFGRVMSPVEDIYMHFLPNSEMVQSINFNQKVVT